MRFTWDREKAAGNLQKHGILFDEAVTVFYDPLAATAQDPDHSADERRLLTIGYSGSGRLVMVSHVERGTIVRIISARLASGLERKRHEN